MTALARARAITVRPEHLALALATASLVTVSGLGVHALASRGQMVAVPLPRASEPQVAIASLVAPPPTSARPMPAPTLPALTPAPIIPKRTHPRIRTPRRPAPAPAPRPSIQVQKGMLGESRRVRVADSYGRVVVARVYGGAGSRVVMLPDGQLGWPNGMVYTNEPFQPRTADQVADDLSNGPYRHFQLIKTDHYLIFHTSSPEFAKQSGQLLESLYRGLIKRFCEGGLPVHESEFPLVAVVFRNETEFREHREVARDVQAYYEVLSNRVFLFESKDGDQEAPVAAAMRKPQTVAHEGTHQILQNIGVQPRLAPWPAWLVEGLAEYSSPRSTRKGDWVFGGVNPFHVTTMRELEDTLALQVHDRRFVRNRVGAAPGRQAILSLVQREELSPTDYATAWGLTHYLATERRESFAAFLNEMSQMSPLASNANELTMLAFRRAFGAEPAALGQSFAKHLAGMKGAESQPYFAVVFEQPIGDGLVRRGTMVSQSPQVIREWVEGMAQGADAPYAWYPHPFSSYDAAASWAKKWTGGR